MKNLQLTFSFWLVDKIEDNDVQVEQINVGVTAILAAATHEVERDRQLSPQVGVLRLDHVRRVFKALSRHWFRSRHQVWFWQKAGCHKMEAWSGYKFDEIMAQIFDIEASINAVQHVIGWGVIFNVERVKQSLLSARQ